MSTKPSKQNIYVAKLFAPLLEKAKKNYMAKQQADAEAAEAAAEFAFATDGYYGPNDLTNPQIDAIIAEEEAAAAEAAAAEEAAVQAAMAQRARNREIRKIQSQFTQAGGPGFTSGPNGRFVPLSFDGRRQRKSKTSKTSRKRSNRRTSNARRRRNTRRN